MSQKILDTLLKYLASDRICNVYNACPFLSSILFFFSDHQISNVSKSNTCWSKLPIEINSRRFYRVIYGWQSRPIPFSTKLSTSIHNDERWVIQSTEQITSNAWTDSALNLTEIISVALGKMLKILDAGCISLIEKIRIFQTSFA